MKIPRNWSELTVGMYEELYPTFSKEYKNPVDKVIEQIMILTDKSLEEIHALPIEKYQEIQQDLTFLNEPIEAPLKKKFWIGRRRYKFETNARKLNGGSYMSVMHIQENDPNTKLHQVLFTIAKPINILGKEKKIGDFSEYYEDNIESFKEIPMSVAYPIVSFFLTLSKRLMDFTEDYLVDQMSKMTENLDQTRKDLAKDLDG